MRFPAAGVAILRPVLAAPDSGPATEAAGIKQAQRVVRVVSSACAEIAHAGLTSSSEGKSSPDELQLSRTSTDWLVCELSRVLDCGFDVASTDGLKRDGPSCWPWPSEAYVGGGERGVSEASTGGPDMGRDMLTMPAGE